MASFKVLLALASSTLFVQTGLAQEARLQAETGKLRAAAGGSSTTAPRRPARDRYDVVVLQVEFQPDTTRFTTGDGTFSGSLFGDLSPSIDPLPHDAAYVEAHLSFLRDYIARVSDQRTHLRTHLLPGVVRVGSQMGDYSPTGPDADSDVELAKLARLVDDAWSLADPAWSAGLPALDPETTAFMLLHAGVGRDVELIGTTLDKTPEDLPSLFLDRSALDRLTPGTRPEFGGIPVSHGLIVPRTETRKGFNSLADEEFLAEFSVNGLLAASFLNFLGVPDLFDTETGESAIGPFGLMDGLGIFAYSGLFPPEPSAWTKYFLGWDDPVPVAQATTIELEYVGAAGTSHQARAPISEAEYFLVENRHRDPEGDGVVMQVWNAGTVSEVRFDNGAEGFNSATVSDFPGGVVLSVDQYDFALPGGKDEDGIDLVGGILIWHIDERVIAANLSANRVNADPDRRGVDVEEADGAQDLGHPSRGLFGPSFHLGSPFDFFYEGNPVVTVTGSGQEVRLYENLFGPATHPSSAANDGGPGFVVLSRFTEPGSLMSFRFRRLAQAGISPAITRDLGEAPGAFAQGGLIRFLGLNGVLTFSARDGTMQVIADDALLARVEGLAPAEPAIAGNAIWSASLEGFRTTTGTGTTFSVGDFPADQVTRLTTPVLARPSARGVVPMVGASGASGHFVVSASATGVGLEPQPAPVVGLARAGTSIITVLADRAVFPDRQITWTYPPVDPSVDIRPQFGRDRRGIMGVVPDVTGKRLHILWPEGDVAVIDLTGRAEGTLSATPTLADMDNDGLLDVLIADDVQLWAISRTGSVANGFPVATRARVVGAPLVVDSPEDADIFTVVVTAEDGQLDAYRPGVRTAVDGFPLSLGVNAGVGPTFRPGRLMAVSGDGSLAEWAVDLLGQLRSAEALGDESNSSFVDTEPLTTTLLDTPRLLVPGETYNWPNPVREGVTRFRILPTEDCSVEVFIVDVAGNEIDQLRLDLAPAEIPSELEWRTTAESGLYIARIRARSTSGRTEDALVKVAIMR